MESKETTIVNLKIITQQWSCNSCSDYEASKEERRVIKYTKYRKEDRNTLHVYIKEARKSLQHPSTLPKIPIA